MNSTNTPGPVMEVLGSITYHAIKIKPLLPTYLHLIVSSIFPIYAAAHASLRRPVSAAPAKDKKRHGKGYHQRKDESDASSAVETLTTSDAIMFPILAGFTLTGLYLIIKWMEDPKLLNQILGYYFSWVGIFFSFKFVQDVLYFARSWVFPTQFSWNGKLYMFDEVADAFIAVNSDGTKIHSKEKSALNKVQSLLPTWLCRGYIGMRRRAVQEIICTTSIQKPLSPLRISFATSWLDLTASAVALFVAFHTVLGFKTPWYLTNLQGFAFCYGSLQFMSPGTSAVASLLLSLLFIYDIYMVFYTPMMVTVATKLDVPIKLLFPKNVSGVRAMAMLGLGDIVIPGIVMAFALRFDLYRYYVRLDQKKKESNTPHGSQNEDKKADTRARYISARGAWAERTYTAKRLWTPALHAKSFPKPYFTATMVGYIMGMLTTVLVMTVFDHAQPALLYLVPGVLLSFWGTALIKGEIKLAWNFDEAAEEKEKEKKKKKEDAQKREKEEAEKKAETEKDEDIKVGKNAKKPEKSTEEKEVESGLKPFFTFKLYFPRLSGLPDTKFASLKNADKEKAEDQNDATNKATGKDPARLDDAETQSETSTESEFSSDLSADIVSQEEALEAERGTDAISQSLVGSKDDDEAEVAAETQGTSISTIMDKFADAVAAVPSVSTKDDEGGAKVVKRRRRA